jgi:glycosyltransferase involved in cell wall biosynthesis
VARRQLAPRLLVAGRTGNATSALERWVADSNLADRVTLLGPRDDVADLLSAADVFVLPSRWEGFPGAVVEAMALEAPIVASDLPGVREALGPRLPAVLVPPESAKALASALEAVLDDPRGAANRAAEGRSRFLSHFTMEEVAAQMAGFYERALAGADRP